MDENKLNVEIADAISTLRSLMEQRERKDFNTYIEDYIRFGGKFSNTYQRLARLIVASNTVFYIYNGQISGVCIYRRDIYKNSHTDLLKIYSKGKPIFTTCVDECEHCTTRYVFVYPNVVYERWQHKIFKQNFYKGHHICGVYKVNSGETWIGVEHGDTQFLVPITVIKAPEFRQYLEDAGYTVEDTRCKSASAISFNNVSLDMWSCTTKELDGYQYRQGKSLSKWLLLMATTSDEYERAVISDNLDYLFGYKINDGVVTADLYKTIKSNEQGIVTVD